MARQPRSAKEKEADSQLGKRLATIRKQRGYTQVELAAKMGTIQTLVSDYERGRLRTNPDMLTKFAKALLVTSDEILGLKESDVSLTKSHNRRFLRRLSAIDGLPKRDQDALLRTIDAFLAARKAG